MRTAPRGVFASHTCTLLSSCLVPSVIKCGVIAGRQWATLPRSQDRNRAFGSIVRRSSSMRVIFTSPISYQTRSIYDRSAGAQSSNNEVAQPLFIDPAGVDPERYALREM